MSSSMGFAEIDDPASGWAGTTALERQLLGAVLRDNAVYWLVKGSVDAADFGAAIDQRVYAAIKRRLESGETAEPSTVATMLGNCEWDAPGGAQAYLTDLADKAASPAQAGELARRIGQVQSRRRKNVPL